MAEAEDEDRSGVATIAPFEIESLIYVVSFPLLLD